MKLEVVKIRLTLANEANDRTKSAREGEGLPPSVSRRQLLHIGRER